MNPYIIEHPTFGTFRDFEGDPDGYRGGARFSVTGMRNDPERTMQFTSLTSALRALGRIPPRIRAQCNIMQYGKPEGMRFAEYVVIERGRDWL